MADYGYTEMRNAWLDKFDEIFKLGYEAAERARDQEISDLKKWGGGQFNEAAHYMGLYFDLAERVGEEVVEYAKDRPHLGD